jgi:hypothetical protein
MRPFMAEHSNESRQLSAARLTLDKIFGCHSSRFSFRRAQCVSFREVSNSRWTFRFNALMTPMRAIMAGPLSSTTRSNASTAARHSSSSCSALALLGRIRRCA